MLQSVHTQLKLPLVLISQIQRSGGTLLSQLFDGHPQVLSFPHELHLVKKEWPNLADKWGDAPQMLSVHDRKFKEFVESGYHKFSIIDHGDRHRFDYDFNLRNEIMSFLLHGRADISNRDVFNAFFSAFFAAWRSRPPGNTTKINIVAFAPRTNIHLARSPVPSLFSDYPDGHLITLVRRPLSWFASARRHHQSDYEPYYEAMRLWIKSVRSSQSLREAFPDQVTLLTFESLVSNTEATMRSLCESLGLIYDPIVCIPTFGGAPIKSDSNFEPSYGIDTATLQRDDFVPTSPEDVRLHRKAEQLYERIAAARAGHTA